VRLVANNVVDLASVVSLSIGNTSCGLALVLFRAVKVGEALLLVLNILEKALVVLCAVYSDG
jgi:hypothetical protein